MGKSRQKSRRSINSSAMLADRKMRHEPHWQVPSRAPTPKRAMPLENRNEPLVTTKVSPAIHRHEPSPADLIPIPRNRALAVPRTGPFYKFTQWLWGILPKKPGRSKQRREVELTAKKLKELRRQISVMEKTLGRLS